MADSPRVTELRRDIAEMEANRGHLDPAMTDTLLASLREDLAEALGEAPATPARPQVRPRPSLVSPSTQTIPAAPAALEVPMPRKTPPPAERLEVLRKRLAGCSNRKAEGLARMAIRKHCEAHGLPVPPEAAIVRDSCLKKFRKTAAKAPATAPYASASPVSKAAKGAGTPGAPSAAHHPAQGAGELHAPAPKLDLPPAVVVVEAASGSAPAYIRALRSQALEMLPLLEDLDPTEAAAAHDEMDTLAKVLVLGGVLIARRTA